MKDQQILRTRAEQLAAPPETPSSEPTQVVVVVQAGQERYALPAHQISMVRATPPLTRLPGLHPVIVGMISLQGHVLTVLDLAALLGDVPDGQAGYIVVYRDSGKQVALRVRNAEEAVDIPLHLPRPAQTRPGLSGVWKARVTLLDLEPLFAEFMRITGGDRAVL
ncbi:chemotaxis protein CheW [Deinococcus cellulosilyticus]|uniref:CheW-like domain-containing protein n=1 Tax=Deinococcus cellulosilyticus (strain DSM 18568 / NBRC 106333 / KACC 11606 / 5516J-15) TaxID=1223518 RepID=A0A511MUX1_DEIC1|nr:chemotaxis protein CheW [Deinococcus cellulosilyticus]GEM44382.1 hypothetical protein DC3_00170 [Deinococcus cellulosilyticus NBRC 106333 = KACC 11606]